MADIEESREQESDILKELTHPQYDELLRSGSIKNLSQNTVLFRQGDDATNTYYVKNGKLKLTKINPDGREVIIRYVYAGGLTAAVSVLKDREYPVTAESIEETEVIGWDKRTILSIMKKNPDIAVNSLMIVLERLEELQNRYLELCAEKVEQRLAHTILRLSKAAGVKTSEGICIDLPLSRQNIADYAGTTVFTASRILSEWERKGWIKSDRGKITISNPHKLMIFSESGNK